jgi:hypothetical protein
MYLSDVLNTYYLEGLFTWTEVFYITISYNVYYQVILGIEKKYVCIIIDVSFNRRYVM